MPPIRIIPTTPTARRTVRVSRWGLRHDTDVQKVPEQGHSHSPNREGRRPHTTMPIADLPTGCLIRLTGRAGCSRFTCRKCRTKGRAVLSRETPFAQGPWYQDAKGLLHNCVYCRSCGAVHDTTGSLFWPIKVLFGGFPSKVVLTLDPSSFQKVTRIANPDCPGLHPLILRLMLEDGTLTEQDVSGDPPTMAFLSDCMDDEDFIVRREAVVALERFSSKQAVNAAVKMLHDGHWAVRRYAARALGNLGDASAIEPLNELLLREIWQHLVRKEAALALKKLRGLSPPQ